MVYKMSELVYVNVSCILQIAMGIRSKNFQKELLLQYIYLYDELFDLLK